MPNFHRLTDSPYLDLSAVTCKWTARAPKSNLSVYDLIFKTFRSIYDEEAIASFTYQKNRIDSNQSFMDFLHPHLEVAEDMLLRDAFIYHHGRLPDEEEISFKEFFELRLFDKAQYLGIPNYAFDRNLLRLVNYQAPFLK